MQQIFNKLNPEAYNEFMQKFNITSDIYFNSGFLASDALLQKGEYEIFTYSDGINYFVYPYIKSPFDFNGQQYFDLIAPYGYAGPICNDNVFFSKAEQAFLAYIKEQGDIITEFVRYHYKYAENQKFEIDILNQKNRDIVLLDLQNPWETIFANMFSSTAKNLIRKMEKQEFSYELDYDFKDFDRFIELYYSNMNHAGATDFYYFSKEYFYDLKDRLGKDLMLAHVKKDGEIYCSSLFFLQSGIITYYLSGRDVAFSNIPSNYYILGMVIKWGTENGFKWINFGGGRTTAVDDSLFKFKSHFSKTNAVFYTGKRVHEKTVYAMLRADFIEKNGLDAYKNKQHILQFYR